MHFIHSPEPFASLFNERMRLMCDRKSSTERVSDIKQHALAVGLAKPPPNCIGAEWGHVRAPSLNNSLEKHSILRILTIYICGLLKLCNASRERRELTGRRCGSGSQTFSAQNLNNRPQISLLFFICSPSAATVVCDDAVLQYVPRSLPTPSIHPSIQQTHHWIIVVCL